MTEENRKETITPSTRNVAREETKRRAKRNQGTSREKEVNTIMMNIILI